VLVIRVDLGETVDNPDTCLVPNPDRNAGILQGTSARMLVYTNYGEQTPTRDMYDPEQNMWGFGGGGYEDDTFAHTPFLGYEEGDGEAVGWGEREGSGTGYWD